VVRLDALRHESAEHISRLWIDYHLNKPSCVSAVAPAHTYARLNQRLAESPLFVIPLPRETGCFVSILLQAHPKRDVVLFTELERYQKEANKGVVPPSLHLRYYPDLVETKGIALVRGEVDLARLSTTDAQYLVNQLQIYYLADNKYQLVKTFNHDPARFDYNSLINDLKGAGSEK
jgi:ATP synthase F1 complex assembly factor 1